MGTPLGGVSDGAGILSLLTGFGKGYMQGQGMRAQRQAAADAAALAAAKANSDIAYQGAQADEARARSKYIGAQTGDIDWHHQYDPALEAFTKLPAFGDWYSQQSDGVKRQLAPLLTRFTSPGGQSDDGQAPSAGGPAQGGDNQAFSDGGFSPQSAAQDSAAPAPQLAADDDGFLTGLQRRSTAPGAYRFAVPRAGALAGANMMAGANVMAGASPIAAPAAPAVATTPAGGGVVGLMNGGTPGNAGGFDFTSSPEQRLKIAQLPKIEAETKKTNAETDQITATLGNPFPFLDAIGQYTQPGAQAIATRQWNESHGTHFGVPGVDFQGTYSLNSDEALKQLNLQSEIRARDTSTQLLVPKQNEVVRHDKATESLTQRGQNITQRGQDITARGQDLTAGTAASRLQFETSKYNAFPPAKQAYITSQRSRLAAAQSIDAKAQDNINKAMASAALTPFARKAIIDDAKAAQAKARGDQASIQADINRQFGGFTGGGPGATSGAGFTGGAGSIPVIPTPQGAGIGTTAQAMQKSGQANQPHYCEKVARQTYQQNTDAYDRYWGATAKSTVGNFLRAGLAQQYTPGMQIPGGSLLYSTNGKYGHVQVVDNAGARYDQYGKNQKFAPGYFQYFVPPPGASARQAAGPITGRAPSGLNYSYAP